MPKPVTIGERRRMVEKILLTTSVIQPEPPSGIPFSAIKLLSIVVLVYSFTLTIEGAWTKNLQLCLPLEDIFSHRSPFIQLPWQSFNILISVLLVIGTFKRNPPIVLIWLLYGMAAELYLMVCVPLQIYDLQFNRTLFFDIVTIFMLSIAMWMLGRFLKEIHEDTLPDPEWDFYSELLMKHAAFKTIMDNTPKIVCPPPQCNSNVA